MKTLAVLHAPQLVTLAGPTRPRVGAELSDLSIIPDGGMLARDGAIVATGPSDLIEKQMSSDAEVVDHTDDLVVREYAQAVGVHRPGQSVAGVEQDAVRGFWADPLDAQKLLARDARG